MDGVDVDARQGSRRADRAALPRGRLRLRHQVQHPADAGRAWLPHHRAARASDGRRGARVGARRHLPGQRPWRPGAVRLRDPCVARADRARHPDLRHLPRPPDHGAGVGREDAQDEVRSSRRQPSGAGPRHEAGADHVAEPTASRSTRLRFPPTAGSRTCRCSTARCRASRGPTSRRSASRVIRKRARGRTMSAICSIASWRRWRRCVGDGVAPAADRDVVRAVAGIESRIHLLRGSRVMLSTDLAHALRSRDPRTDASGPTEPEPLPRRLHVRADAGRGGNPEIAVHDPKTTEPLLRQDHRM